MYLTLCVPIGFSVPRLDECFTISYCYARWPTATAGHDIAFVTQRHCSTHAAVAARASHRQWHPRHDRHQRIEADQKDQDRK